MYNTIHLKIWLGTTLLNFLLLVPARPFLGKLSNIAASIICRRLRGSAAHRVSVSELAGKLAGVDGYTQAKHKKLLSINDPAVKFPIEAGFIITTASRNPVRRKAAAD